MGIELIEKQLALNSLLMVMKLNSTGLKICTLYLEYDTFHHTMDSSDKLDFTTEAIP